MKIWRVVVSHTSEVEGELAAVEQAIRTVNGALEARGDEIRLQLYGWKRDVLPGAAEVTVQHLIDDTLRFDSADIVIGIFWTKLGTPVGTERSGSVHELQIAHNAWKQSGKPHILVYFNTFPKRVGLAAEARAWADVLDYKEWLKDNQVLVHDYSGDDFERTVTRHLLVKALGSTIEADRYLRSPVSFIMSVDPTMVRAEGLAEPIGDLLLQPTLSANTPNAADYQTIECDVEVALDTHLVRPKTGPPPRLVVRDGSQTLLVDARFPEGASNKVTFDKVPIRPRRGTQIIVSGIRANAIAHAVVAGREIAPITAQVSVRHNSKEVAVEGNLATVANIQLGCLFCVAAHSNPLSIQVPSLISSENGEKRKQYAPTFSLVFREGFLGAFKSAKQEAGSSFESGPSALAIAKWADWGTRFGAFISNVPADVSLFVTATNEGPAELSAILLDETDFTGANGRPYKVSHSNQNTTPEDIPWVRVDTERRLVAWEWISDRSFSLCDRPREVRFGVLLAANKSRSAGSKIILAGGLAPNQSRSGVFQAVSVPSFLAIGAPIELAIG